MSDYDTPNVDRENYESCREEERESNIDRFTVSEGRELEREDAPKPDPDAVEEVRNNVAIDHANDMRI